ncbi:cysteinyl-tRNA synthetase, partial [Coemansia sp. RSA 532]
VVGDVTAAFNEYVNKHFKDFVESRIGKKVATSEDWKEFVAAVDQGKDAAFVASDEKTPMHYNAASTAFWALSVARLHVSEGKARPDEMLTLTNSAEDVLSPWLDRQHGAEVTDQRIFRDLAAFWEKDFFEDMDALNVRRPHVLTRVSEFVDDIVRFVQRIIDNGYAYEVDGSVYFDVGAFDGKNDHFYAKLEPNSKGNSRLLADGEGSLTKEELNKRS